MIYLDNAATSFPKPPEVMKAVAKAITEQGGNPGRSSHALARRAADAVFDGREAVASLFNGKSERVVFTQNATYALNLAIKGLIPKGAHVLLSDMEHNATLRPVLALEKDGVTCDFFSSQGRFQGDTAGILASLASKLRENTAAIIACHRSNILPIELPLKEIGEFAASHGLLFIVDASQSAGMCEIDMEACGISALCAPAHKGLFGIRGCGFVIFSHRIDPERIVPLIEGGSGSDSQSPQMPTHLPERLEAGTLPVEAIAALTAGIDFVKRTRIDVISRREEELCDYLRARLLTVPTLRLYLPRRRGGSVLLFNLGNKSPAEVARVLDAHDIALREGLHCAPLAHRLSGTLARGALRASVGYFNEKSHIDALVDTLQYAARH